MKQSDHRAHAHLVRSDYGNVELCGAAQGGGHLGGVVVPGGMLDVRRLTDYVTGRAELSSDPPDNDYVAESAPADPQLVPLYCADPHADGAVEALIAALKTAVGGLSFRP